MEEEGSAPAEVGSQTRDRLLREAPSERSPSPPHRAEVSSLPGKRNSWRSKQSVSGGPGGSVLVSWRGCVRRQGRRMQECKRGYPFSLTPTIAKKSSTASRCSSSVCATEQAIQSLPFGYKGILRGKLQQR